MVYDSPLLTIDIGSSSLRVNLFAGGARRLAEYETQAKYEMRSTPDGGADLDPDALCDALFSAIDRTLASAGAKSVSIAGVGFCSLVSNVLGVDALGRATTPVYTWADTRCAAQAEALKRVPGAGEIYERTGCSLHTAYLPARLVWVRETMPAVWERTALWVTLGDFIYARLFGRYAQSTSVASWSGLLNRHTADWDDWLLALIGVDRLHLPPLVDAGSGFARLRPQFAARWPALKDAIWFPCVGDGLTSNLGSGCYSPGEWAVQVGTSAAIRALVPTEISSVPPGLWCYRQDSATALVGGALSEGGNVFAWLRDTLRVTDFEALEVAAASLPPDAHGLTMLPFIAGERSPGWNPSARMTIAGISSATRPVEILRAAQEAIAYRLASVYDLMRRALPEPEHIVASGGALLGTPGWVQMLADVLGRPVTMSGEEQASSKGAAILALRGLGHIAEYSEVPTTFGETFRPDMARYEVYRRGLERQHELYKAVNGVDL
ncbi:MAG TPA: gluconokinase [Chloroflexia bacterium]|nr:gluconokinase [Chloroflexia bacterium]